MASKRHLRRKMCEGKVKFESYEAAAFAIYKHRQKGSQIPYHCRFCGGWHNGHPKAYVRKHIQGA